MLKKLVKLVKIARNYIRQEIENVHHILVKCNFV